MPEGPSIVILREAAAGLTGRKVLRVSGNSTQDIARMQGQKVLAVRSWGKHFCGVQGFSPAHHSCVRIWRLNESATPSPARCDSARVRCSPYRVGAFPTRRSLRPLDCRADCDERRLGRQGARRKPAHPARSRPMHARQYLFAGLGNITRTRCCTGPRAPVASRRPAPRSSASSSPRPRIIFDFYRWRRVR